jgi:hypothetical protein
MESNPSSLDQKSDILEQFVARQIKRGYQVVSHSVSSAELYKPAGFPAFLAKETTLYVIVDESGRLFVQKRSA